ncbi:hypothetical protein RR42_m0028 [Cupriavidus basilensis]|uniref:Uncharacterized protein n=1 Tax=Cupriavidus basilensis TaxID=68895 RepID=A0A0C4Y3R6_9BURK|nr:hypothetical protein RR42_m0028 [Cupriavidus basilensis]
MLRAGCGWRGLRGAGVAVAFSPNAPAKAPPASIAIAAVAAL